MRPLPYDLQILNRILHAPLITIETTLFIGTQSKEDIHEYFNRQTGKIPMVQVENDWNRHKFDYDIGETAWEFWQNNLTLAQYVKAHLKTQIEKHYNLEDFVLYISNETVTWEDGNDNVEQLHIMPALRLWSKANDPDSYHYNALAVSKSGPDILNINTTTGFQHIHCSEIFTRQGAIRKPVMRQILKLEGYQPSQIFT